MVGTSHGKDYNENRKSKSENGREIGATRGKKWGSKSYGNISVKRRVGLAHLNEFRFVVPRQRLRKTSRQAAAMALALALAVLSAACGGGGDSGPPPPPPPVTVTVAPATQNVLLGATQTFTATVTNATSTSVTWSVNGVTGGNSTVGTIDANGLYRGPAILSSPAAVTIRATSVSSPGSFGTATVTVTSDVVVSITAPAQNASVEVGAPQPVTKNVASAGGVPDTSVTWTVSGNGCAGSACGTINAASGLFTAPGILPSTPNRDVTVTATSVADPTKSATLTLHIVANFGFTINGPPGNSINNATQFQFVPTFTPVLNSAPVQSVTWSVSGPPGGCVGTACGTIDQAGLYTAPTLAPSPPQVTITALPLADPSKGQSSGVTINSIVLVAISPTSLSIEIEGQQNFTANVGGTQNQNVTWSITGPNCANPGNPCGSISNLGPLVGSVPVIYTAPITIPSSSITVTATSVADITKTASTTPTFFSTIQASLLPSGATRAVNHRQTLDAVLVRTFTGTAPVANAVDWRVNGVLGGNTTVGQICLKAADGIPCSQTSVTQSGPPTLPFQVDYLAPAAPPGAVTIEMRSQADSSKFTTATVTVAATVTVNVSPSTSTLPTNGTQQFTANVVGAFNQGVTWSVSGAGCSGPGLAAGQCGMITSSGGLYTAPVGAPASAVTVTATSVDDPLQSGSGTLTVAAGAFINKILPASITSLTAGSTDFTIKVQGLTFVSSTPGPGSTILFNSAALNTNCSSSSQCTATILASSVISPGDYGVQIKNPDNSVSNQVALKVLDATTERKDFASAPVVTLTAGNPNATGHDILVVEPTTAGSLNEHFNMDVIGIITGGSCNLRGTGITLTRPLASVQDFDICVQNNTIAGPSLLASDSFTISGPNPNDITIQSVTAFGGGGGIIQIKLQIGSASMVGPRTLFAESKNREKAALVGGIEVK
jgi:hypothetical protein